MSMAFNPSEHVTRIQGREYLEVKWRQVWFRDVYPLGSIVTEIVPSEGVVVVKATIAVDGVIIATAHGSANDEGKRVVWAGKSLEKAETAAIGRALANAGFGTQFTEDDETGVVDSPIDRPPPTQQPRQQQQPQQQPAQKKNDPAPMSASVDEFYADTAHIKKFGDQVYYVFAGQGKTASTFDHALAGKAGQVVTLAPIGAQIAISANVMSALETKKDGSKFWKATSIVLADPQPEPAGAAVPSGANVPF